MAIFLIACINNFAFNNKIIRAGFRFFDTEAKKTYDLDSKTSYLAILAELNKGTDVRGVEPSNNKLIANTGSFDRYPQILLNNTLLTKSSLTIIKEYPNKEYDVCNYLGTVAHMTAASLIEYSKSEGLSNGKVVDNSYISSIKGEFIQDQSFKDINSGKKVQRTMMLLGDNTLEWDSNNFVKVKDTSVDHIKLNKGMLGISDNGFADCINITEITIPNTCIHLGEKAFFRCTSLTSIVIPEGTVEIPKMCFAGCKSLATVTLPNSLRKVHSTAFRGCNALKSISVGPIKIVDESNLNMWVPAKAKVTIRR